MKMKITTIARCLVPAFDGAYFSERAKEAPLWAKILLVKTDLTLSEPDCLVSQPAC